MVCGLIWYCKYGFLRLIRIPYIRDTVIRLGGGRRGRPGGYLVQVGSAKANIFVLIPMRQLNFSISQTRHFPNDFINDRDESAGRILSHDKCCAQDDDDITTNDLCYYYYPSSISIKYRNDLRH
jgi:hypothetical protein